MEAASIHQDWCHRGGISPRTRGIPDGLVNIEGGLWLGGRICLLGKVDEQEFSVR